MGSAAFVIVSFSKRGRANRDFTSPPQCAMMRSCGARRSRFSEKLGLSHVVIKACTFWSFFSSELTSRESSICQRNRRDRRFACGRGKKDAKRSGPAHTIRLGRDMGISLTSFGTYFFLL